MYFNHLFVNDLILIIKFNGRNTKLTKSKEILVIMINHTLK